MTIPLLACHRLTKHFGGTKAVDDVDLEVFPGRAYGLIGSNGAGKTTMVNLLTGSLKPTTGTIQFGGRDVTRMKTERRAQIGMARTFQVPRPFRRMTLLENAMVGSLFGRASEVNVARAEQRAQAGLELVGLLPRQNAQATTLSVGEAKLLELARCLAMDPRLIFLDEVTAGLNDGEREEVKGVIRTLIRQGITLVIIEHIVDFISDVCSDLIVLDFGRLLAVGDVTSVLNQQEVVEAYLGTGHDGPSPVMPI